MTATVKLSPSERLSTRLVTPQAVAVQYGIPCRTQSDLRDRGEFVSVTRVGGRLYYFRDELEAWLRSQRVVTIHLGVEAVEMEAADGP
ncbi:helix-turn-helix domain-containing protein [Mycobacterium sp.]|uniref:helix-turn-helix domain-containing protein n=1 Tax=Mycobacterium sp. TaxID=1785 RepID=UPI003F96FCBF